MVEQYEFDVKGSTGERYAEINFVVMQDRFFI